MARQTKDEAPAVGGAPGGPAPCAHCGYDLTGLDTLGPCPECGKTPTCIACGYDLTGLSTNAPCPECGLAAQASLRGDLVQIASPEAIKTLHHGLILVLTGVALTLVFTILSAIASAIRYSSTPHDNLTMWDMASAVIGNAITLVYLAGYWLLSRFGTPDGPGASTIGAARAMRAGVIVNLATIALYGAQLIFGTNPGLLNEEYGWSVLVAWVAVVSAAQLSSAGLLYFGSLAFVAAVAMRLPDRRLRRRARRLMWLGPTIAILGLVLFYLGPLLAIVMYWYTLDTLLGAVTRVRRAAETVSG